MKKVRFETPSDNNDRLIMESNECQSPRPFLGKGLDSAQVNLCYDYPKIEQIYTNPVQCYEYSDSSPYPLHNKISWEKSEISSTCSTLEPSKDLELSIFDSTSNKSSTTLFTEPFINGKSQSISKSLPTTNVFHSIKNVKQNNFPNIPNVLTKDNGFFIRPDTSDNDNFLRKGLWKSPNSEVISTQNKCSLQNGPKNIHPNDLFNINIEYEELGTISEKGCTCHHCGNINKENCLPQHLCGSNVPNMIENKSGGHQRISECTGKHCHWTVPIVPKNVCKSHHDFCAVPSPRQVCYSSGDCNCTHLQSNPSVPPSPQNTVEKKTLAIEKYEQNKNGDSVEIKKSSDSIKEKREPTVADLFKIIKLQNEQLNLLQEKVDKFISNTNVTQQNAIEAIPIQNFRTEQVAVETLDQNHHKISIGVMTSFEMVRTSTFINSKHQNAQVQCNASQINLKEVVTNNKPLCENNFLAGITPVDISINNNKNNDKFVVLKDVTDLNDRQQIIEDNVDKTVNELSLCNLQIDNAMTPYMSPDQSLYLNVKDYSE